MCNGEEIQLWLYLRKRNKQATIKRPGGQQQAMQVDSDLLLNTAKIVQRRQHDDITSI